MKSEPILKISASHFKNISIPTISLQEAVNTVKSKKDLTQYYFYTGMYGRRDPDHTREILNDRTLDGWYLAFITRSGDVITSAMCFKVDSNKQVTDTGEYVQTPEKSSTRTEINPAHCDYRRSSSKDIIDESGKGYVSLYSSSRINEGQANEMLSKKYPQFASDFNSNPSSIQYYHYANTSDGYTVVRSVEASGIPWVLSATCYDISANGEVKSLGSYTQSGDKNSIRIYSYDFDPNTCKFKS
jgi:hypothetical protein